MQNHMVFVFFACIYTVPSFLGGGGDESESVVVMTSRVASQHEQRTHTHTAIHCSLRSREERERMFSEEESHAASTAEAREFLDKFLNNRASAAIADDVRQKLCRVQSALTSHLDEDDGDEEDEEEGKKVFRIAKLKCRVAVSAAELGDVAAAVNARLGAFVLGRVVAAVRGIIVGYRRYTLPGSVWVMWDLPWMIVPVDVDALVFAPHTGLCLRAAVSKRARDHISLLALGVFNVAVSLADAGELLLAAQRGTTVSVIVDRIDATSSPIVIRAHGVDAAVAIGDDNGGGGGVGDVGGGVSPTASSSIGGGTGSSALVTAATTTTKKQKPAKPTAAKEGRGGGGAVVKVEVDAAKEGGGGGGSAAIKVEMDAATEHAVQKEASKKKKTKTTAKRQRAAGTDEVDDGNDTPPPPTAVTRATVGGEETATPDQKTMPTKRRKRTHNEPNTALSSGESTK